jgi:hypothetical protein
MSEYNDMGHAMRRRVGAASNSRAASGKSADVAVPDLMAQHITANSARIAIGAVKGTLIPKKNTQAGDPTGMGTKKNRKNVSSPSGQDRMGAAYKVSSSYSVSDPAAGQTMRSARIVPSTMGARSNMMNSASDSLD